MQRCDRDREDGFTLVEVLVAMAIFSVVVSITLGLVWRTSALAASNSRRVVAASLVSRQIESARSQRAIDIPNGAQVRVETVGGVPFTITQTANFLTPDATTSVCRGSGSQLAYKLVTVTATWPAMGSIPAVRADTLRTIGIGEGLDATRGSVAVAVLDAAGGPVSGVTVSLGPADTVLTGVDGCAVVTGLAPGTYAATATAGGYVGSTNAATTTLNGLGVSAGAISRATILVDRARSVTLTPGGPAGYQTPPGLALSLRNTYLPAQPYPSCSLVSGQGCVNGLPGLAVNLFPAVYDVWAGTCADAAVPTAVDLTSPASDASTAVLGIGHVSVDVQVAGVSQPGRVVYAVHAADPAAANPGCVAGETYALPATASGGVKVLLPYGTWRFSLTPVPPVGAPALTLSSAPAAVVVTSP